MPRVFSLGWWSTQIPTRFPVSRGTQVPPAPLLGFVYGALTLYDQAFQPVLLPTRGSRYGGPTTPHGRSHTVWAFPLSLAATQGIISFPRGTKMFQFPRFPLPGLCVQPGVSAFWANELPHSGIPGSAYLAASRGLSQPSHALRRLLAPRHPPRALSSFRQETNRNSIHLLRCSAGVVSHTKK